MPQKQPAANVARSAPSGRSDLEPAPRSEEAFLVKFSTAVLSVFVFAPR